MSDINPDMIAQLATRIYNETRVGNPAAETAQSAARVPSEIPATPTTLPPHMGNVPFSVGSLPHAGSMPHVGSMPSPGSIPDVGSIPHAGSIPHGSSIPHPGSIPHGVSSPHEAFVPHGASLPGMPSSPGFGSLPNIPGISPFAVGAGSVPGTHSAPNSSSGLSAFVQKIRESHFGGRSGCLDPTRSRPSPQHYHPTDAPASPSGARPFDVPAIREDFPILRQRIHGKPLAWFDNAATTQKPQSVIDAVSRFYENDNSNIHRAAHTLAARATDAYEGARKKVQQFLGASTVKEIVFVRGTTEGINLITQTYGRKFLQPGDEVVLSMLEHHANIVPWQAIAKEKGAVLRVIPVNDRGEVMLEEYQKILGPRTKVVALTQASNSLGTILPVGEMTQMAKRYGARVLIDGAQSVAHIPVNMQQLGADFFVFSGHKIFGPTGIGAVYIKEELHDILPPWQGGGNMIRNVTFEETTFSDAPAKFEAGTPNIADAVGLGAALDYVQQLGLPNIAHYEHELLEYATDGLTKINGLRLIGTAREKVGVLSFVLPNRRTEEIGRLLDQEGIAVRSGHHCSQPSLRRFGVETTVRPSLSLYNTKDEIDRLVDAVKRIQRLP